MTMMDYYIYLYTCIYNCVYVSLSLYIYLSTQTFFRKWLSHMQLLFTNSAFPFGKFNPNSGHRGHVVSPTLFHSSLCCSQIFAEWQSVHSWMMSASSFTSRCHKITRPAVCPLQVKLVLCSNPDGTRPCPPSPLQSLLLWCWWRYSSWSCRPWRGWPLDWRWFTWFSAMDIHDRRLWVDKRGYKC